MKKVVNNARELYRIRNYIISVFEGSEVKKLKQASEIQEPNFDWMFKEKAGNKELEKLSLDVENVKKSVKENKDLKNISKALLRFINKILLGNINNLEKALDEYNNLLNWRDVKNLLSFKRIVGESDASIIRSFFKDLEYTVFGSYTQYQTKSEENKKLEIATGGQEAVQK